MPLAVQYHPDTGIVETTLSGKVTPIELKEETIQAAALAQENNSTRFLSDFRKATVVFSLFDVFELPSLQEAQGLTRSIRVAVLPPEGERGKEVATFYETICVNRGWMSGVFEDRQEAMKWLGQ